MNKQELAARVWQIANDLRGSMEASEYKDYILGFIFYKYLSDNEHEFLIREGYEEEDIQEISEENEDEVKFIQNNIGYFIAPDNLFNSWVKLGNQFGVDQVMTALSAFQRNINSNRQHQKVFSGIFQTLETGIQKLGSTTKAQTKQVRALVNLIKDIPTTNDEYDVLGYIYEFLIGHFAAGAGKKAGEFYTPAEVSQLMSEIIADHVRDRDTIEVYDPTSGSGSLLITIGQAFELHQDSDDNVKYYAQDKIRSTEILTRMNLIMRGVRPSNIVTRNGDSLEQDFPYFEESDPEGTYDPVFVDAVVSNPPYSQKWEPEGKEQDIRFASYGTAPKSKADYAFLLHALYHLKSDGIMTIVLPHGVLFRGGEEGRIRQNLVEKNNIDAIIGLPANIFYGTGIPTIVIVLKKDKKNSDILFVDASKGFAKKGNQNVLRAQDIKRAADAVIHRREIEKFSHLATLEEIQANEYNLNIPRYIDSSEAAESYDILALMNGGIPKSELTQFEHIFKVLPGLYNELFTEVSEGYVELKAEDIKELLKQSESIQGFRTQYKEAFHGFSDYLKETLIENAESVHPLRTREVVVDKLFQRFQDIPLVDRYKAYEIMDSAWEVITNDIEVIQSDSLAEAVRAVDPNMVIKKRNGEDIEVQEGTKGRIIPFDLVQATLLKEESDNVREKENRQTEIQEELTEIIESLSEEDGDDFLNAARDRFTLKETQAKLDDEFETMDLPELNTLAAYKKLTDKNERVDFVKGHPEIQWQKMDHKSDGTPTAKGLKDYEAALQQAYEFPEDSLGAKLSNAISLMDEEKALKGEIKDERAALEELTEAAINNLSDAEAAYLLNEKWIKPFAEGVHSLVDDLLTTLEKKIAELSEKYSETLGDIEDEIQKVSNDLISMMDELTGRDSDMEGIRYFQQLLGGELSE